MAWDEKLKRLQQILNVNQDGLAERLGLTPRTLSDLMKPGSRDPSGPVMKLINLFLGEQPGDERGSPVVMGEPLLNLVIIHEDWGLGREEDPVDAILDLHRTGGRNNEFHYVTVTPILESKWMKWVREGLMKRQVQPHFFDGAPNFDSQEARICFFAATAMVLAAKAMRKDLAHITLAAGMRDYWPLARELREAMGVDVTIACEGTPGDDSEMEAMLSRANVNAAYPFSGRKIGVIESLKADPKGNIAYGFIREDTAGSGRESGDRGKSLFFSYNHMLKDTSGHPETEIGELNAGDGVTFAVGVNHRGRCAVDVTPRKGG